MITYKKFNKPDDFGIDIDLQDLLAYETANSFLAQYLSIGWMKDLYVKYLVKKTERKYKKYIQFYKTIKQ